MPKILVAKNKIKLSPCLMENPGDCVEFYCNNDGKKLVPVKSARKTQQKYYEKQRLKLINYDLLQMEILNLKKENERLNNLVERLLT